MIPTLSALFTSAKQLQKPRPAPYETRQYRAEPLVLIIAPTRELCSQIFDECRRVSIYIIKRKGRGGRYTEGDTETEANLTHLKSSYSSLTEVV